MSDSDPYDGYGYNLGFTAKLIGTYINMILFGVEILAAYCYFTSKRFKRDLKFVIAIVIISVTVDALGSFASCANVFVFLVIECGSQSHDFLREHWTIVLWVICSAVTEFAVQLFMVYRYYRLSSNRIVAGGIFFFMLFSLIANTHLGAISAKSRFQITHTNQIASAVLSLATTAVADLAITLALIWKLHTTRTYNLHTKHLIRRVSASVILTGSVTSAVAIATLISFVVSPRGDLSPCFGFFLGRVYTLTMLFTLLTRDMISGNPLTHIDVIDSSLPVTSRDTPSPATPTLNQFQHDTAMVFAQPSITHSHDSPSAHSRAQSINGCNMNQLPSRDSVYVTSSKLDQRGFTP